jgi:hypothetical protein
MPYIQRTTPPANKVHTFSLRDYSGGINNASDLLEQNEASDLMNLIHSDVVLLEKRKGQEYIGEFVYGSPIRFIDEFKPYNHSNVMIVGTDTHVFINEAVLTDVHGRMDGVNHKGKYFFTDGRKLYVYGLFAQTNSTYDRIIGTPINQFVLLEVVSPATGHAQLDQTHTTGVTVVDYTNYRVFYEPCKLEFEDPFKGANVAPASVQFIVSHNGRLFMSGDEKDDDNVFITDVKTPYYFPVYLPMQLPPNSDKVKGLEVFDNSVVVARGLDKYVISGNTSNPNLGMDVFMLKRINTHTGIATDNVMDVAHNYLFYLGNDGSFYALDTTRDDGRTIRTTSISKKLDLFKAPFNLTKEDLKDANSLFVDDFWYVRIKDVLLVYYYPTRSWVYFRGVEPTAMYEKDGKLIYGLENGRLAQFSDTMSDFGKPYKCYWYSKFYDMGDANAQKQFRDFFIIAHTYMDYDSDIFLTFEVDYSDVTNRVMIENQIAVWGKTKFGQRLINRLVNESFPIIIGRRGRNIRIKFMNGYQADGEVDTREDLTYYVNRRQGMVLYVREDETYNLYDNSEWIVLTNEQMFQKMKVYQINGDYEFRGKR